MKKREAQTRDYHAFMLRLWPVNGEAAQSWRASLESARSGEIVYFATLNDLFDFIWERAGAEPDLEAGKHGWDQRR
jgi:hypothetical protein